MRHASLIAADSSSTVVHLGPALAVVIVLLAVAAAVILWLGRTGHHWAALWASTRGGIQLALLALVIGLVIHNLWATAAFVVLMAAIASITANSRITRTRPTWTTVGVVAIAVCAAPIALVVALIPVGVLPANGLAIIPTAGILMGNAMNTASLTGRRANDELLGRAGEVEAAMSLGFLTFDARMEVCREAAATALVPSLDQTRTVGLVTIPGSFVGMVLGGATPAEAAIMQLFVLVGILAVSSVSLVLITILVANGSLYRPQTRHPESSRSPRRGLRRKRPQNS